MTTQSVKFKKESADDFYPTIKKRVNEYFEQNNLSKLAPASYFIKISSFILLYFFVYFNLIFNVTSLRGLFFSFILLGFLVFFIFLNVVHDAAHGSIFKKKQSNHVLLYFLEMFGTSNYIWRIRHLESHHIYPNIFGLDTDIKQSDLVRISNQHPFKIHHQFQHLYMPILYFIYTLNWTIVRDFRDITSDNIGPKVNIKHPWEQVVLLLFSKLFYFFYTLILPVLLLNFSFWAIFGAFLVMHFTTSFCAVFILVSSHVGEDAVFPKADENRYIDHTWAEHQLIVTADFAADNRLITTLVGGFNLHVVHHLFPHVSHAHYPVLTKILKETAAEFGLSYNSYTLKEALISHWKLLKKNSFKEHSAILNEA
ncbi:fatty acid desaturase family protein [Solitalea koreensis]|uniref:Linoleoyl-CoA desaturase n=1 Tax=Solitalea koreensis TaxID=543615 RepID=A0A521BAN2_9SPHI|nr:acyl-CoA desaturase [Solitalea koreensis]SMO44129.1 linoleoyl-CoA desaturase [Solitalea koreensis]